MILNSAKQDEILKNLMGFDVSVLDFNFGQVVEFYEQLKNEIASWSGARFNKHCRVFSSIKFWIGCECHAPKLSIEINDNILYYCLAIGETENTGAIQI